MTVTAARAYFTRSLSILPWAFLVLCAALSFHCARIGWNEPLLDLWRFRETQTALAARDFVQNGFHLDYATPVLGAPWSIPFEFPTYQFFVALLVKVSGLPLEPAGRWVSLVFAYLSFALLGVLVWRVTTSWASGVYATSLALISPIYIYGARAVMIESTALCFTLGLLVAVQEFIRRPARGALIATFLCGLVAGPTKGTTYAIGLVGIVGLLLVEPAAAWARLRRTPHATRLTGAFLAALLVPFLLTIWWTHYTDVVKLRNELAGFLTSSALREWNFGTWQQRLSLKTWEDLSTTIMHDVLGLPLVAVFGLLLVAVGGSSRRLAGVFAAMFLTGLLVFTNLYLVHNYYHFATGVYLLAIFGLGLGRLWDRSGPGLRLLTGLGVAPLLSVLMQAGYREYTLPRQLTPLDESRPLAEAIKRYTPRGSAIIVYGSDWDSALPYHTERHALMERDNLPPGDPKLQRALARLDRPLSAVVFHGIARERAEFVQRQLNGLHAIGPLVFSDPQGDVYLLQPAKFPSVLPWRNPGFDHLHPQFQSAYQVRASGFKTRSAMMVHAPGLMTIPKPAEIRLLRFSFGLEEGAYQGGNRSDGVTFVVDFTDSAGKTTRLWERRLEPLTVEADRGSHTVEFLLPADQAGTLYFRTDPGPASACDWAVWHDVQFQ